jgi:hypothetical protein
MDALNELARPTLRIAGVALLAAFSALQWYLVDQAQQILRERARSQRTIADAVETFEKAA